MDGIFYGFSCGASCKLLDDIFDMYGKENVNAYMLELLKNGFVMLLMYIIQSSTNYFIYLYYFFIFLPICVLPKAYVSEPFWASLSILFLPIILYKLVTGNIKPIKLIVLYYILFYTEWSSASFTEIGEYNLFHLSLKQLQPYFPKMYSFMFEEQDMEFSKKKLYKRMTNVVLCIVMLLYGNDKIINYFEIEDKEFSYILPITSWFILGYNLISVINQSYMIFYKKTEEKITV